MKATGALIGGRQSLAGIGSMVLQIFLGYSGS